MKPILFFAAVFVLFSAALSGFAPCVEAQQKENIPIANLTVGWTYLWADQGAYQRSNLNGWFARPAFTLPHGYSVFANFTNYYGANRKGSINSHGFTFGVAKIVFPTKHIRPAIFAEVGDVRSSNAGTITNQFVFATGASFTIPIRRWVGIAVTPAEYVFLYPHNDPRNDFNAKAGFVFNFGHR